LLQCKKNIIALGPFFRLQYWFIDFHFLELTTFFPCSCGIGRTRWRQSTPIFHWT